MIPLGIYRTEKVSFSSLDPSYKSDEENNKLDDGMRDSNDDTSWTPKNKNNEEIKKTIKYVISNPDKDLRLKEKDVVFVLA